MVLLPQLLPRAKPHFRLSTWGQKPKAESLRCERFQFAATKASQRVSHELPDSYCQVRSRLPNIARPPVSPSVKGSVPQFWGGRRLRT